VVYLAKDTKTKTLQETRCTPAEFVAMLSPHVLDRNRWKSVLLDQQPSLLTLRQQCSVFVRMIHRYYAAVRLLGNVHAGRTA